MIDRNKLRLWFLKQSKKEADAWEDRLSEAYRIISSCLPDDLSGLEECFIPLPVDSGAESSKLS